MKTDIVTTLLFILSAIILLIAFLSAVYTIGGWAFLALFAAGYMDWYANKRT